MYKVFSIGLVSLFLVSSCKAKQEAPPEPAEEASREGVVTGPVAQEKDAAGMPAVSPKPKKGVIKASVVGEVELLASIDPSNLLIHNVVVADDQVYIRDAAGMIMRVPITGGEFETVHDSKNGAGVHAGAMGTMGDVFYYTTSPMDNKGKLYRVQGGKTVEVAPAIDVLQLEGDENNLLATIFKGNDLLTLGDSGFETLIKTPRPGTMTIVGERVYWSSYQRGTVFRAELSGKKKKRLAKTKRIIGTAVIGETVYYGTEDDGGIHAVPTSGGPSKLIVDGFVNNDELTSDGEGIYFSTWGSTPAVVRLDHETHKVETLVYGLDAPRDLAVHKGWLYIVGGESLMRVKTDARMPWPVPAK